MPFRRVAFFAINPIAPMTELTWDYGVVRSSNKSYTVSCKCGAAECRGEIEILGECGDAQRERGVNGK